MWRGLSRRAEADDSCDYLVMVNCSIVGNHERLDFLRHHSSLGPFSSERLDCLHGVPGCDNAEFDSIHDRSPQNRGTDETWYSCKLRKRFCRQVGNIAIRIRTLCNAAPLSRNHRLSPPWPHARRWPQGHYAGRAADRVLVSRGWEDGGPVRTP